MCLKTYYDYRLKALILFFGILFTFQQSQAQAWDTLAEIPAAFTFPVVVATNGKVHIMGGGGSGGATTLHYAYDPSTDTWERMADIPYAAQQPAGSATTDKIHFFGGGFPNSGSPVNDHYIYDVATNTWEQGADLTSPRAIHDAVTINNEVYSVGGQGVNTLFQKYNAEADQWENQRDLPSTQFWYGAHVGTDAGKYYRFCGGGYTRPNNGANVYDVAENRWRNLNPFPNATHGLQGAAIGNSIFLLGGYHTFEERKELYLYDTDLGSYTETSTPLPVGRNYHRVVSLDSCLYVLGGNHAIDPLRDVIRTQLLRICPFENSTSTNDPYVESLRMNYSAGTITVYLDEAPEGNVDFQLFDSTGKSSFRKSSIKGDEVLNMRIDDLPAGIYIGTVKTKSKNYSGKLVIRS